MSIYHTSSAATATELVTKLKDFCVSHGWTVWQDSDISNRWVVKSPTGEPVCLWGSGTVFYMQGVITGTPNVLTGWAAGMDIYSYTLTEIHMLGYDSPDIIYFVMKFSNGIYRQGVIGEMSKLGAFTGGTMFYVTNHYNEGHTYAGYWPNGGQAGNRRLFGANTQEGGLYIDNGEGTNWRPWYNGKITSGAYSGFCGSDGTRVFDNNTYYYDTSYNSWARSDSDFNWSTHLVTLPFYVARENSMISPIGFAPHIRATKGKLLAPDQLVNVGGDQWRVWPMIKDIAPSSRKSGSYDYYFCFFVDTGQETPTSV